MSFIWPVHLAWRVLWLWAFWKIMTVLATWFEQSTIYHIDEVFVI